MNDIETKLVHHGAAANLSCSHALVWVPSLDGIVYSSHSILNICQLETTILENGKQDQVWNVQTTLRSKTVDGLFLEDGGAAAADAQHVNDRIIKTVAHLKCVGAGDDESSTNNETWIATGFSDGTVNVWYKDNNSNDEWNEYILVTPNQRSITDLSGIVVEDAQTKKKNIVLVTGSSEGLHVIVHSLKGEGKTTTKRSKMASYVTNTVLVEWVPLWGQENQIFIMTGTAQPRHNKIHLYTLNNISTALVSEESDLSIHHCGHLSGHEDWITSLAWHSTTSNKVQNDDEEGTMMLASGSQDARVRLWKFTTVTLTGDDTIKPPMLETSSPSSDTNLDDDELELSDEEDDDNNQEARLEIYHPQSSKVTRITLEALLFGHEESVTSVTWHPDPQAYYGQDLVLISSSMDRTLLIWGSTGTPAPNSGTTSAKKGSSASGGGVWTPLTRVGSAGGIIGGSIGSTLLGFVNVAIEPTHGTRLVGHAYGGSLHCWTMEMTSTEETKDLDADDTPLSLEDLAARIKWKATSCLTGHFNGVTDLCWDALSGEYLLTTSNDQTCRLWGNVTTTASTSNSEDRTSNIWIELARPQVHGYDLTTLTSISTKSHPYWMVSGADEKELRVFDAPKTTIRMLQAIGGGKAGEEKSDLASGVGRVERAYIPSLGLSNKAEAADGAEEEEEEIIPAEMKQQTGGEGEESEITSAPTNSTHQQNLPSERDLGVLSLWPEVRKLYGHNTELFCLTSTATARTALPTACDNDECIVASSAKARDVENASIRLWDVEEGKCLQTLKGGHRSTVAALAFSPNGQYLSSSGKDRRLCLWRRNINVIDDHDHSQPSPLFDLATAVDSAHKRIIWSIHFCPFDSTILASGSRDGCIKIWKIVEEEQNSQDGPACTIKELYSFEPCARAGKKKAYSVTALSFAPKPGKTQSQGNFAVLSVGVESGLIELWQVPLDAASQEGEGGSSNQSVDCLTCLPVDICHASSITKLAWKPLRGGAGEAADSSNGTMTLASSSMDYGCRVFEVKI